MMGRRTPSHNAMALSLVSGNAMEIGEMAAWKDMQVERAQLAGKPLYLSDNATRHDS